MEYVNTVFGKRVPSYADFLRFEGPKNEGEYTMEICECRRRWPSSVSDAGGTIGADCRRWMDDRRHRLLRPNSSLYYRALRKHFEVAPSETEVTAVRMKGPLEPVEIEVRAGPGSPALVLHHAATAAMTDVGLVWLFSIDGNAVENAIASRDAELKECLEASR